MLALLLGPTVLLAVALELLRPGVEAGLVATLAKSTMVTSVWCFTAWVGWRHGRWAEAIRGPRKGLEASAQDSSRTLTAAAASPPPSAVRR